MSRQWMYALLFPALGLLLAAQGSHFKAAAQDIDNETCLGCHSQPGMAMTLDNGETVSLSVDPAMLAASVHGQEELACVQCHTDVGEYPHPTFHAADRRDFNTQLYRACQSCHQSEYEKTLDSVHERARAAGIPEAALCTDCHGSHDTRRLTDPQTQELLPEARTWIPQTCAKCHSAIYDKYLDSVHGSALIGEGNTDVPTCIDCHGVHDIGDPTTAAFRLASPELCASCHTDSERMAKYGLSTQVLNTYVADFHGTTVTLFEKLSPDAVTNKPVCYDCHGVHDIQRIDDPEKGLAVRQNLLVRCQRCHPEADADFPDAWLSHYIPSADRFPLVFSVNLFYKILIPVTLGGMALLIGLDLSQVIRSRRRGKNAAASSAALTAPATKPSEGTPPEPAGAIQAGPNEASGPSEPSAQVDHD
jgi:hypothetical protein